MTERQIRSYRDDLLEVRRKHRKCDCEVCRSHPIDIAFHAVVATLSIVLGEKNIDTTIEAAAAMARR